MPVCIHRVIQEDECFKLEIVFIVMMIGVCIKILIGTCSKKIKITVLEYL